MIRDRPLAQHQARSGNNCSMRSALQATHLTLSRQGSGPAKPAVDDGLDIDISHDSMDGNEDGAPSNGSGRRGVAGSAH